jgi:hypothetical protein
MLHRDKRVSELSVVVRCGTSSETGNAPNILAGKPRVGGMCVIVKWIVVNLDVTMVVGSEYVSVGGLCNAGNAFRFHSRGWKTYVCCDYWPCFALIVNCGSGIVWCSLSLPVINRVILGIHVQVLYEVCVCRRLTPAYFNNLSGSCNNSRQKEVNAKANLFIYS